MDVYTTDVYEGCYYLLGGCALEAIEVTGLAGRTVCRMRFQGEDLGRLQVEYQHGRAQVDLFSFRRAYRQLSRTLTEARRAKRERV